MGRINTIKELEQDLAYNGIFLNRSKVVDLYRKWKKSDTERWVDFVIDQQC